ncbi:fatty acid synthase-like [Chironomus tepperi]|uniref:fatty acid synthase-like n=1 Tax=Chironomus tepperi TaxID=113505 RepID=UPI00391EE1DD
MEGSNDDNEIVISGISGRFPRSINVKEFEHNLYNKNDMIDDEDSRWDNFNEEVPHHFGKVQNLEKFDAAFFSVLSKHANWTDPQIRMLLEHAYEAILDAGVSPQSLIGSRTGVFIGNSETDAKDVYSYQIPTKEGYGMVGNAGFYLPNRISYVFGLTGPSLRVDSACSSAAYALNCAFDALNNGSCDAALVGGANLLMSYLTTIEFWRGKVLSPDGKHRSFDEHADGFNRSETVGIIFLQKHKDAKRVYATVINSCVNNDGFKEQGSSFPSRIMQEQLMRDLYKKSKVSPNEVKFVEAHATGTVIGDCEEISAIDAVYCENRQEPLLVGSIKSNMGHAESASAIASLTKIVLAFERRQIPPNIKLKSLRSDVDAFKDGRIKVVTDVEDLRGDYISMNNFGLGGANSHILLKRNLKEKLNNGMPSDNLDRLLLWSGRTEEAVNTIFDEITQRPLDTEFIALLQNSQTQTNLGNNIRGYGIFHQNRTSINAECIYRHTHNFNGKRRQVVWIYNGIGSQWPGMGADLMKIPIFANSINKSAKILANKGLDLKHIITTYDDDIFSNVLNSYVGIVAIEIALTDVLKAIGIKPDFIVGHSLGEIACAYADGCFTAEETILVAYERGQSSVNSDNIDGAMAAVGMGYQEILKIIPKDIDIACHNSADSTTITGPAVSVDVFVKELASQGIFVKKVQSSGVALHSRYLDDFAKKFKARLNILLTDPKKRSEKWLSTCYPKVLWDDNESQYSSPDYHVKNLTDTVLFQEVIELLPNEVITMEIGPSALLKSILKRSQKDATYVSLTQRDNDNATHFLLNSLGNLFENGIDMDIANIYPKINYPVSRGTPMISPLIKWNHKDNFTVPIMERNQYYQRRNVLINLNDKNYSFIQDHIIDGRILIPGTLLVYLVWESFNLMFGNLKTRMKIIFEDVKLTRITFLERNQDILLCICINRGSGYFEVTEKSTILAQGYVKKLTEFNSINLPLIERENAVVLTEADFYKEMRLRGYHHQGIFRGVKDVRDDGLWGKVQWNNNWCTFLDALLQVFILMDDTRALVLPTYFGKILIDPDKHFELINGMESEEKVFEFLGDKASKTITIGGVEIHNFDGSEISRRRETAKPVLETHKFISNFSQSIFSRRDAAKICVQLLHEKNLSTNLKCVEVNEDDHDDFFSSFIYQAFKDIPAMKFHVTLLTQHNVNVDNIEVDDKEITNFNDMDVIVKKNCVGDEKFLETVKACLKNDGFLIAEEVKKLENEHKNFNGFKIIARYPTESSFIYILQEIKSNKLESPKVIKITTNVNEWLEPLQSALKDNSQVIAYSQNDNISGILGLINCIRREQIGKNLRCVFIDDDRAPKFSLENSFYRLQLELGFAVNILRNGNWGTFKHLDLVNDIVEKPHFSDCYVKCLSKGDLSSLSWIQGSIMPDKPESVRIHYSTLNFKDLMIALGQITPNVEYSRIDEQKILGIDWSGVSSDGKRVFGAGTFGGLSAYMDNGMRCMWEVPDNWTLEEAATVPIVYTTAYLAFFEHANIEAGKSILIHSGAGGVGQAAIQVAFAYGLEVFTTVSSDEKKEFLLNKFPQLKSDNIGNSRDTSFERMIMTRTNGKGVNYVLNSLSGDKLQASIKCLAKQGIFLEIGKYDMVNRTKIDMRCFAKDIGFRSMFVENLFNTKVGLRIYDKMAEDMKSGIIKPIDYKVFNANEIEDAFRFLTAGKHIGKVLVKVRENESSIETLPIKCIPTIHCYENESCIIVGGLGGFGLELADLLVLRGCKNLVLSSSRGIVNSYQAYRIRTWESYGCKVVISTSDIKTKNGCQELISVAKSMGIVSGIFNLAVNLHDAQFEDQTVESFEKSLAPKAIATKHLDELSQHLCPKLRYFVIFSSISCGRGNASQSNYGMSNSIMERIIEKRHRQGLPAKAIQWGAIGVVGILANLLEKNVNLNIGGTLPQTISSCLDVIDALVTSDEPIVSSIIVAKSQFGDGKKGNFIETMLNILGISDKKSLSMDTPLSKLGIDSLIAVEIQQVLERDYDILYSAQELRSLTLRELEKRVQTKGSTTDDVKKETVDIANLMISQLGDEMTKDKIVVAIPSRVEDKQVKALIIPGFEGMSNDMLSSIGKKLQCPAYILQLSKSYDATTLQDILSIIWNDIIDLFSENEKFLIIGYSFGSLIALKIANILESLDKTGNLVMIDGSPHFVKKLAENLLSDVIQDDEKIRERISIMSIKALEPSMSENVIKDILSLGTFKEQFEKFKDISKSNFDYSQNYIQEFNEGMFNRSKIALDVNENSLPSLHRTPISLLKSTESSLVNISDDYELKKFSSQNINVHKIAGNHQSMLGNLELVEVLNNIILDLRMVEN